MKCPLCKKEELLEIDNESIFIVLFFKTNGNDKIKYCELCDCYFLTHMNYIKSFIAKLNPIDKFFYWGEKNILNAFIKLYSNAVKIEAKNQKDAIKKYHKYQILY